MAAYSGGDHIVYRTDEPWNQYDNLNPKTLRPVGPDLIRPLGKTVIGPDGAVWTGWSAAYGVYGGGLSRVDPVTREVSSWQGPVPGQQVCGLAADGSFLYLTTNGGGNGLAYKEEEGCCFAMWDPAEASVVYLHRFEPGIRTGFVLSAHGYVWMRAGNEVAVFDPERMDFVASVVLDEACGCLVKFGESSVLAFGESGLFQIHAGAMQARRLGGLPPNVTTAAVTPDGSIYFNQYGTRLYKLRADDLASPSALAAAAADDSRKE
jgi:streptogramin lyase